MSARWRNQPDQKQIHPHAVTQPQLSLRPQKIRCGMCNGRGRQTEIGEETCWRCVGTGRDMKSDVWSEPCPVCNGRGRKAYCRPGNNPCITCNGRGYY